MVSLFHPVFSDAVPASVMFNNNNYLPNLNHCPLPEQLQAVMGTHPQALGDQHSLGMHSTGMQSYSTPGTSFRFLSPTQGTSMPTWAPTVTSVGMTSAPGVGVNWQHSVPTTMPWANHIAPHFSAQTLQSVSSLQQSSGTAPFVCQFPADGCGSEHNGEVSPYAMPVYPHHRHLKRRSLSPTAIEGPHSKRRLSEKMAAWFKGLQITNNGQNANGAELGQDTYHDGWQRFSELEKRLEDDFETIEEDNKNKQQHEPRLVFANGMEKNLTPKPILPEGVVNSINKPCMELILWQPPEAVLKNDSVPVGDSTEDSEFKKEDEMLERSNQPDKILDSLQMSQWFDSKLPSYSQVMQIDSNVLNVNMFDSMDDEMDL